MCVAKPHRVVGRCWRVAQEPWNLLWRQKARLFGASGGTCGGSWRQDTLEAHGLRNRSAAAASRRRAAAATGGAPRRGPDIPSSGFATAATRHRGRSSVSSPLAARRDALQPHGVQGLGPEPVGFRWLGDQVGVNDMESFATVGFLSYSSVAPRCVRLSQSTTVGEYATTVLVQYWPEGTQTWLNHTIAQGLGGGTSHFRLPLVPLTQAPR